MIAGDGAVSDFDIDEETRERYAEQGWGESRIGFGERPALIIVDMQRDFVDVAGSATCAPMAQERLAAIQQLLVAARGAGIAVFHTQGLVQPDLSDVGLWKGRAKREGRCQVIGTRGAEIVPELAPLLTEQVVEKTRPSGFFGTDLHLRLQALGIDTLLLAGASMSGCVRATAVDGFSHDYRVSVVRDCVVDRSEQVLEANLFDVDAKYGDAISLDEALAYLETRGAEKRIPTEQAG
ncbi:MAG: isochorismatase family protein [Acidimicrobiia bacterium]|nr:isochorismatase family protein [Acidimicrobiia bacterium]